MLSLGKKTEKKILQINIMMNEWTLSPVLLRGRGRGQCKNIVCEYLCGNLTNAHALAFTTNM